MINIIDNKSWTKHNLLVVRAQPAVRSAHLRTLEQARLFHPIRLHMLYHRWENIRFLPSKLALRHFEMYCDQMIKLGRLLLPDKL